MITRGFSYYEQHFVFSNRLVLFVLGLSPRQNSSSLLILFSGVFVCLIPLVVHQIYTLKMKLQTTIKILESIIPATYFLYCYYMIYFKLLMVKLLCAHIKNDYELLMNDKELNIIEKYTNQSKLLVCLLVIFFNFYYISITSPSILNVILYIFGQLEDIHLTLPFPINNISRPGLLYYSLLIYQIILIFIVISVAAVIYSMYWSLIQHICAQFSILIEKIRQPFENNDKHIENIWCFSTFQQERNWLIDVIKCYTRVTELVNLTNEFSKMTYLIAVCVSIIIVIFNFLYMFQLFTVLLDVKDIIEGIIFTTGFSFTLYITFYIGQLLTNHSNAAFAELCNIPFYTLSIETQKLLLFLLTKSINPCEISIGKLFVASHKVFAALIQKAFSFATVYYNMI